MKDNFNICLASDSYKFWHWKGYLPDTKYIYSYLEARKGARFNKTLFYGLQYILKKYLTGVVVTREKIAEAKALIDEHLGPGVFNEGGWNYILNTYNGKLPVRIKAVKEGSLVDVDNVMMTIENTDSKVPWLTGFLETILMQVWYPCTVATQDWELKKLLSFYYEVTGSDTSAMDFAVHGFGMRAATSFEACGLADSAHLLNFKGTDTVPAIQFAKTWYNAKNCPGFSVAATEHSVMTARGEEGEWQVLEHLLRTKPDGVLAMVIDSFNWKRFIDACSTKYRNEILSREGRIVFRPDSGDPVYTTIEILNKLRDAFGYTRNKRSYKVLNPKVRVLWGDGIGYSGVRDILFAMKNAGYAAENVIFGMGGHMVQDGLTRDTQRFAFKASATVFGETNEWHNVYKKPIDRSKTSKKGRLALIRYKDPSDRYFYKTIREDELKDESLNLLEIVFENGEMKKEYTFEDVKRFL